MSDFGKPAVHPGSGAEAAGIRRLVFAKQMASQIGGIFPVPYKRTAIRAAGGHLGLSDRSVLAEVNPLDAALPAERCTVGMPVIEDIPFPIDSFDAAMVISAVVHRLVRRFVGIDMKIVVADEDSLIDEAMSRKWTGCVTQLMHDDRGVDQVISIVFLTDRRSFKKRMSFKLAPLAIRLAWRDKNRFLHDREHIRAQHRNHRAVSGSISGRTESGI
ncbi:hypothetical protein D3C81_1610310 [compost metagenome]